MTESSRQVDLLFLWHMHQPSYRVPGEERLMLPWVRLHAVKAYNDMAAALEAFPAVRANVNFSGVLLEQMWGYIRGNLLDEWWELSLTPPDQLVASQRRELVELFFSIHWDRLVRPHPRYAELLNLRSSREPFEHQDLLDLQALFNLQWIGFAARHELPELRPLLEKERDYTTADVRAILKIHLAIMREVPTRWQRLADRGQVELTFTPMYHPILPLLIDSDIYRVAMPDRPGPRRFSFRDDALWHVQEGRRWGEKVWERDIPGCWPAEGSVSDEALEVLAEAGVKWCATDEWVLNRSHRDGPADAMRPWRKQTAHGPVTVFFRDHWLSDRIGFDYARNAPDSAASDFIAGVKGAAGRSAAERPCVSVVLDGENPWEAYPDDGKHFLYTLYERLTHDAQIQTVTGSERSAAADHGGLIHIHPGSWIDANYRIWIGQETKNRAWELLGLAREMLSQKRDSVDSASYSVGHTSLMQAEGSDWFWWYGDDFSSMNDRHFDALFRHHCRAAYTAVGEASPSIYFETLVRDYAGQIENVTPPETEIVPSIDGRKTDFYEWQGAGELSVHGPAGAMNQTTTYVESVRFGFGAGALALRVDPSGSAWGRAGDRLRMVIRRGGEEYSWVFEKGALPAKISGPDVLGMKFAWKACIEWSLPLAAVLPDLVCDLELRLEIFQNDLRVMDIPQGGWARLGVLEWPGAVADWLV